MSTKTCRCGHAPHRAQCPAPDGCWCDTFSPDGVPAPPRKRAGEDTTLGAYADRAEIPEPAPRVPEPDPRTASRWVREALRMAEGRDPVDAANDAEYVAALLAQRAGDVHEAFATVHVGHETDEWAEWCPACLVEGHDADDCPERPEEGAIVELSDDELATLAQVRAALASERVTTPGPLEGRTVSSLRPAGLPSGTEALTAELNEYLDAEGLPRESADELLAGNLTTAQRRWLHAFVVRWDIEAGREGVRR
jgi:hypothetical protein